MATNEAAPRVVALWFGGSSCGHLLATMLVAGVDLSSGEAWLLAQRLYRAGRTELAVELGRAVDVGCTHFLLTWGEHVVVLVTLERDCPAELQGLRDALWAAVTRRRAS